MTSITDEADPATGATENDEALLQFAAPRVWPLLVVVLAEALIIGFFIRNSYYFADDGLIFEYAHRLGFGGKLFFLRMYGHVAPVERMTHLLIVDVDPISYALGATVIVLLITGLLISLLWVLRELRVPNIATGTLLVLVGLSTVVLNESLYYDQIVFLVPASIAVLLILALFLRWHRTGRMAPLVAAWVLFPLSFVTQERPIVVLPFLVLLRYVVLPRRPAPGGDNRLAADWRLWSPFAVVGFVYVLYYTRFQPASPPKLSAWVTFVWLSAVNYYRAIVALPFGSPPAWLTILTITTFVVVIVPLLVRYAIRRTQVRRALIFALATFVVNIYPVMHGAGGVAGAAGVADQLQYYLDPLLGLAVAAGLSVSPWIAPEPVVVPYRPVHTRRRRHRSNPVPNIGIVVASSALILHVIALAYSAPKIEVANELQVRAARWASHVDRSLDQIDAMATHATVIPLHVPSFYIPEFELDAWREDLYFPVLHAWHAYSAGPVEAIDFNGDLRPVLAAGGYTAPAYASGTGQYAFNGLRQLRSAGGMECGVASSSSSSATISLPGTVGYRGGPAVAVDLQISVDQPASLRIATSDDKQWSFSQELSIVNPSVHRILTLTPAQPVAGVGIIDVTPGVRICLGAVQVGGIEFAPDQNGTCWASSLVGQQVNAEPCGRTWQE